MRNNFPKTSFLLSLIFFIFSCAVFVFLFLQIKNKNEETQSKELAWQTETLRRDEIKALDHSVKIIEEERKQLETHFARSSAIPRHD